MFKVYFENRFEERIFLAEVENEEMIYQTIKQDISTRAQPSFEWYYTRTWTRDDGEKVYDCGSWCEFYIAISGWNNENHLNYTQKHDKIKEKYFKDSNIKLVTISYKDFNKLNAVYLKDKLNI